MLGFENLVLSIRILLKNLTADTKQKQITRQNKLLNLFHDSNLKIHHSLHVSLNLT